MPVQIISLHTMLTKWLSIFKNRLFSNFALRGKISIFCADLLVNFESICEHMVKKFNDKDAKKDNFSTQMEFRKKSKDIMNRNKSEQLFQEAKKVFVGGVNSPVRSFKAVDGSPLFFKHAKGSRIYSEDGDEFIDYVLSWGPFLFGHSHPFIVEAIQKAIPDGTSFGAPCAKEIELAKLIQHFFPSCEKIRFVSSGTEATMSAIRLARGFTGRKKIVKFSGCYHGHADGLLVKAGSGGLTFGIPDSAGVLPELTEYTLLCDYNDVEALKALFKEHKSDIAAVILEPVAGNMGVVIPKDEFILGLRDLCKQSGALLIFDEVMTGFRITPGGAQKYFDIKPDLTCLGKVIGGGLPCAAFGGRADIMDHLAPLGGVYHAGTLSGNPICMTAGIAVLTLLKNQPEAFSHAERMTKKLADGLRQVFAGSSIPHQINQLGTMFTLFFTDKPVHSLKDAQTADTEKFRQYYGNMLNQGIYLAPSQFEANFLSSAHTEEDIQKTLEAAEQFVGAADYATSK